MTLRWPCAAAPGGRSHFQFWFESETSEGRLIKPRNVTYIAFHRHHLNPLQGRRAMKAVGYHKNLPINAREALEDLELPAPVPGVRDLLVRVHAVSVNPVDTKVRAGSAPAAGEVKVLGWDAIGVVEAVGAQASGFAVGDRVWYAGSIKRPGANSELHAVDAR